MNRRNYMIFASVVAFGATLIAQTPRTYQMSTYIKCKPGNRTACEDYLNNTFRKAMKARVDQGIITSYSLSRLVEPGAYDAGYTHTYTISSTKPFEAEATDAYNKAGEQGAGMSREERLAKSAEMFDSVSRIRSVSVAGLDPKVEKGDFVRAYYLKIAPHKQADFAQYMQKERKPMMEQIMLSGRHRTWTVRNVLFRGSQDSYNAVELWIYKNGETAMAEAPPTAQMDAWFKKAHPDGSYQQYLDRGRELRDVAMIRTFKILDIIRK